MSAGVKIAGSTPNWGITAIVPAQPLARSTPAASWLLTIAINAGDVLLSEGGSHRSRFCQVKRLPGSAGRQRTGPAIARFRVLVICSTSVLQRIQDSCQGRVVVSGSCR